MNQKQILQNSSCIAVDIAFVRLTGSFAYGALLSQFVYWSSESIDPDGWFTRKSKEIEKETTLSRREQESARKVMRSLGILFEDKEGTNIIFYRVCFQRLRQLLEENGLVLKAKYALEMLERFSYSDMAESNIMAESAIRDVALSHVTVADSATTNGEFRQTYKKDFKSLSLSYSAESKKLNPVEILPETLEVVNAICESLRKAGIEGVIDNDPCVLSLLNAGFEPSEITSYAPYAIARGKPSMGYVMASAMGRRNDAGLMASKLETQPLPRQSSGKSSTSVPPIAAQRDDYDEKYAPIDPKDRLKATPERFDAIKSKLSQPRSIN